MDTQQVKLQALREQQSRWMRERQAEMDRQQVIAQIGASPAAGYMDTGAATKQAAQHPNQSILGYGAPGVQQHTGSAPPACTAAIRPEQVIDKLTERITDRLRSELKVELQRETQGLAAQAAVQAAQQDAFLVKELETQNTCPICYELMVPPQRAPQLLFPCGHTFCSACATSHIEQHRRNHCPVCRKKIDSRAVNYPLQQLITNWVARKQHSSSRTSQACANELLGVTSATGIQDRAVAQEDSADEIRRRCERLELRLRVLNNELLDVIGEQNAVSGRQAAADVVAAHLSDAEQHAQARVAAAQAELDLVQGQQREHAHKSSQLLDQAQQLSASRELLVATISPLQEELAKLNLLVAGLLEQSAAPQASAVA